MAKRYVPISFDEFSALMVEMGFTHCNEPGTYEHLWRSQVRGRSGKTFPYTVKIYSSVHTGTNVTRDTGKDAIRIVVLDDEHERALSQLDRKVYRTKSALLSVREHCRDIFRYVLDPTNHCPLSGHLMVERDSSRGKFLGCTHYPECKGTRPIPRVEQR